MTSYVVSRESLQHNIRTLKKMSNGVPIWAVVKGDGYGLGVLNFAEVLAEEGIDRFCVTELREAQILRENGFGDAQILMLRSISNRTELQCLLDLHVCLTVGSREVAELVNAIAAERADVAEVHLKIDTGMGRYGFLPEQIDEIAALYHDMRYLAISGIYTHFNCAFNNETLTRQEFASFLKVVSQLHARGLETGVVHCCNSAAFLKYPEMHCGGVRLGSAILGRMPFRTKLRPIGQVETQIDTLRLLPKGHSTGYSAIWRAKKETRVAILPVGWYHGYQVSCRPDMSRRRDCLRAALSSLKALLRPPYVTVQINGRNCRVVGAIGMLHCTVDVTGINCEIGDCVIMQMNPLHCKGIPVVFR